MRNCLSTIVGGLAAVTLLAAVAHAQSNVGGLKSDLASEEAVRALYKEFNAAWNRHDVPAMGRMWALDGDHQEPDGHTAKGRTAVQSLIQRQHDSVFKKTSLDLTIDSVWFITGETALVDGRYEISGIRDPNGVALAPRKGHLTSILLKEGERWSIAASRLMIPTELPYKKE